MKTFTATAAGITPKIAKTRIESREGKEIYGVRLGEFRYVRIGNGEFPANMSAFIGASVEFVGINNLPIVVRPNGKDNDQAMVLFTPGPGTWTTAIRASKPCPNRGQSVKGHVKCPVCKKELPAWRRSTLAHTDENIHPDHGMVPESAAYGTWEPSEKITVLSESRTGPATWVRLLVLRDGATIRVATPQGSMVLAFFEGELTYEAKSESRLPAQKKAVAKAA